MAKIVRRSVDTTIEKNILTASIISTSYLEKIWPVYQKEYITNAFGKTVMSWIMDYYNNFGVSPGNIIQDIFNMEKSKLEDSELEIIELFLKKLSEQYLEDQGVNEAYILDQTLLYFRKREIEIRVENAQSLLQIGRIDKAEEELTKMKKVMLQTSNWNNPFSSESVNQVFDDRNNGIFKFPGRFGDLLGPLERGWFVAFLAPFKRGKSWTLQEAVILAAVSGLKAVFVSLEMQDKGMNERIFKRISAYGEEGKTHQIPVFDCLNNQLGTCEHKDRHGTNEPLGEDKDNLMDYTSDSRHRICTKCRAIINGDYVMSTWFEQVEKKAFSPKNIHKKVNSFVKMYGDNVRIICYPRFSASVSDFERDLDLLEQTEGFIPDVISADYADIFKPEKGGGDDHKGIDAIWKNLAALAAKRRLVMFTASQGNRGAIYKADLDQGDLAEWIGKLAHVDAFLSLNQTKEEKKKGVMRIGLLAHRHREFHEDEKCTILQAFSLGQTHLDSF